MQIDDAFPQRRNVGVDFHFNVVADRRQSTREIRVAKMTFARKDASTGGMFYEHEDADVRGRR